MYNINSLKMFYIYDCANLYILDNIFQETALQNRMEHLIFAYGTLKESKIRRALLKRQVIAENDTISGFAIEKIYLDGISYPIAVIDPSNKNKIPGEVFQVSNREIGIIDEYESGAYKRIKVSLKSGQLAWLYVKPQDGFADN